MRDRTRSIGNELPSEKRHPGSRFRVSVVRDSRGVQIGKRMRNARTARCAVRAFRNEELALQAQAPCPKAALSQGAAKTAGVKSKQGKKPLALLRNLPCEKGFQKRFALQRFFGKRSRRHQSKQGKKPLALLRNLPCGDEMVPPSGFEPLRIAPQDSKSCVSASFTTAAERYALCGAGAPAGRALVSAAGERRSCPQKNSPTMPGPTCEPVQMSWYSMMRLCTPRARSRSARNSAS